MILDMKHVAIDEYYDALDKYESAISNELDPLEMLIREEDESQDEWHVSLVGDAEDVKCNT